MNGELDELFTGAETDLENAPSRKRLEAERQKDARAAALKRGWVSWKWRSQSYNGVLDVIYLKWPNTLGIVEYKVPGNPPTELQKDCIRVLTELLVPCTVCYDVSDTLAFLEAVEDGTWKTAEQARPWL